MAVGGWEVDGSAPFVIRGATVVDGTGAPSAEADIVVDAGRIRGLGAPGSVVLDSGAALDAQGLVVCPGFIDVHSHADNAPLLVEDDLTKINQGVTTEVTGNCGFSLAPIPAGEQAREATSALRKLFPIDEVTWGSVPELYEMVDDRGTVVNVCPLVGHGALRMAAMGSGARAAESVDIRRMRVMLQDALEAGAFGMSTGLIYAPGVYADAEELVQVARVLGPDRVYATHMRNESFDLAASLTESVRLAREAGCRLQISHLKATGQDNHGSIPQAIAYLDEARDDGVAVTQDIYPYTAASTILAACLPPWMHDGGDTNLLARLEDRQSLARARRSIESPQAQDWENLIGGAGGYDGILIASTASHDHEGMTLRQVADELGLEPFDALVHVLVAERLRVTMVEFSMADQDLDDAFRSPFTSVGSDGTPPGSGGKPHPRLFGTFPTVISRFVRERRIVDLAEAVRRMTSLPAAVFGVPGRGVIAPGAVADLVCFDPLAISHPGDYATPDRPVAGIEWVMQEGRLVVRSGRWLGVRRGRRLRPR
ncbi:D-aminoacylase [Actinoallomurus sp. NPDC050550]|uniref:N-acyl-D-amino-acid deacylase family protein n=1 Tax=Actinoallomurus sp. NPDC050550 TaxID=3154937 RepID=UPI0033D51A59